MHTLIHERVEAAVRGENPCVICRMSSGWAVLGDHQFLPGYSLLLADPIVDDLNDLPHEDRRQFLMDMAALGDAVESLETLDDVRELTSIVADAGLSENTGAPASISTAIA